MKTPNLLQLHLSSFPSRAPSSSLPSQRDHEDAGDDLRDGLRDELREELSDELRDELSDRLRDELSDRLRDEP